MKAKTWDHFGGANWGEGINTLRVFSCWPYFGYLSGPAGEYQLRGPETAGRFPPGGAEATDSVLFYSQAAAQVTSTFISGDLNLRIFHFGAG